MKGKILCPAGCQNPVGRITKAKEILKNPRSAGRQRPFKCIFSGKKKGRAQRAGSPVPFALYTEKPEQGQSAAYLEQVSTTVPKSAILRFCPSRETCWGVPSPNPALRLAPYGISQSEFLRQAIRRATFLPYMDRPADTKAGCKHRCTDAAMRYFKYIDTDRRIVDISCRPERTGAGTVRHYHGTAESCRGRDRGIKAYLSNGMGAALQ